MDKFFTKKYLSNISFIGLGLILMIFNLKILESKLLLAYSILFIFIIGLTSLILTIYESYFLNSLGSIKLHIKKPTPGKSMFDALEQNGVKNTNILELYMTTYDLKNKYNKDSEYGRLLKKNGKDYNFMIYGYGDKNDINELEGNFKKLKVKTSNKHITEHFNLIKTTQNNYFLWYEPFHKSIDNKEILPDGAYLVSLNDDKFNYLKNKYYNES